MRLTLNTLFLKYHKFLQLTLGIMLGSMVGYFLLWQLDAITPILDDTDFHKVFIPIVEAFLVTYLYYRYLRSKKSSETELNTALVFFAFNALFIQPFYSFYLDPSRILFPIVMRLRPIIQFAYYMLMVGTAALLVIWLDRKIDLVSKKYPKLFERIQSIHLHVFVEKKQEEIQRGQERDVEFGARFPGMDGIPVLGAVFRAIYRLGIVYALALLILVLLGFGLRAWNLGEIPPYLDEYQHLIAAKRLYQGEAVSNITYVRSLYTVTIPVYWSYLIFGVRLWAARFAGVVFNMLAIIPLFLIAKRVNKSVALLAVGLYMTSPWLVAIARNTREYAYYPVYFYTIGLLFLALYESIPDSLVIRKDLKRLLSIKNLIITGMLGFAFFAMFFLSQSDATIIIALLSFVAMGMMILTKIDFRDRSNMAIAFIVALMLVPWIPRFVRRIDLWLKDFLQYNNYYLLLFFNSPEQQWYYHRLPFIGLFLAVITLIVTLVIKKRNSAATFIGLNFILYLGYFTFGFERYGKPRYGSFIEYWFVLVMAVGIYIVFKILARNQTKKIGIMITLFMFLLFYNWNQVILPARYYQTGQHPITNEIHYAMEPVEELLLREKAEGDVLVSSIINNYLEFTGKVSFDKIFIYKYYRNDSTEMIYNTIYAYPSGWIVIDELRGSVWSEPLPFESFDFKGKAVEYLGKYGDHYVYRWGEK